MPFGPSNHYCKDRSGAFALKLLCMNASKNGSLTEQAIVNSETGPR